MDIKSISSLLNFFPDISNALFNYLTCKSRDNYDKLNIALQAYGFTIQQLFDNIDTESFIKSYRETNAIDATISVIQNSDEFTDKEKVDKLLDIHEKEIAQQDRAQKYELQKKTISTCCVASVLIIGTISVVGIITNKGIPLTSSLPKKALLGLPFKKK